MKVIKGLPLLVTSVATLGLAGAVALSPIAGAADTATQTVTINATVNSGVSITSTASNVDLSLSAPDYQEGQIALKATTNSSSGLTMTLQDQDDTTGLVAQGVTDAIPAKDGKPTSGTASWAVNVAGNDTDWKAIPKKSETALGLGSSTTNGEYTANVKIGVATAAETAPSASGSPYTNMLVYTAQVNP